MWYKRTEAQKRFTFFFSSTTLAGAFGGLLAGAIGKMDGIRGYSGWRWSTFPIISYVDSLVFILEGLATCLLSIVGYFVIVDFPEEAKFLSEPEREFIIEKLRKDTGNSAYEYLSWRRVLSVFKDWKIWVGGFMYLGTHPFPTCPHSTRDLHFRNDCRSIRICILQSHHHLTIGIHSRKSKSPVYTTLVCSFCLRHDNRNHLRLPC